MSITRLVSRKPEDKADSKVDPFEARLTTLARTSPQASDRPSLFSQVRKSPSRREA